MMQKRKKKKLWLIPVTVGVIAVLAVAGFVVYGMNKKEKEKAVQKEVDGQFSGEKKDGTITWNGKEYIYNDHLSNFLFLGVDERAIVETEVGEANAGQTDSLFLISWDRVENTITLVSIPRDTMTEIEVFAKDGTSMGKSRNHINLAYAYGDGGTKSCELAKEAVSNLFYGIPIQGYCSLNMDGLPILADSVGGVPVTVPNDSLQAQYPEFPMGAQVVLDGTNIETFVRYRDINISQSGLTRLERQNAFLEAYAAAAQNQFAQNPGFVTQMYTDLQPYMVTNISNDQFVKILEVMVSGGQASRWTVPGEGIEGQMYDEYIIDDEALYAQVIETFYKEK